MPILRALLGLAFFLFLAWLMSSDRKRVNIRVLAGGLFLQFIVAVLILETDLGRSVLDGLSTLAVTIMNFGQNGAEIVFGPLIGFFHAPETVAGNPPSPVTWYRDFPFHLPVEQQGAVTVLLAFKGLPTIIYFSALIAILYHLGVMQLVIWVLAKIMSFTMRVSGAEALAMAANVFVGCTEAPLVVKPYIPKMTRSELMALMTGGFATIAGTVLALYIGFIGMEYAGHVLAASFMSAPAAFVIAKIIIPETEKAQTAGKVELRFERTADNVLDATAQGTTTGLKLFLNVIAMLIAFTAIIALIDWMISGISIGGTALSLSRIFGWVFAPIAWLMGVPWEDCDTFGSLLGTKIAVNEFIAYSQMAALPDQALSERSYTMAAYALCGFSNFGTIGITLGGIGALAPERRQDLSRLALRAMIGGAFASWMTATVAGAFIR